MKTRKRESGARSHEKTLGGTLRSLWQSHSLIARQSVTKLLRTPVATAMTVAVLGIALLLPAGLFVAMDNLRNLSGGFSSFTQITLYLHDEVSQSEGEALREQLLTHENIAASQYISSAQAAEDFRTYSGLGDVISQLDENPLPAVIVLTPASIADNEGALLLEELSALPEVESAQLDLQWIERLQRFLQLAERGAAALMLIFSLAVLFVVGNTIRLAIESRRAEIVVVKLVGGTDGYVARPFLYTGTCYGLAGGVLAWVLLGLIMLMLHGPVTELLALYDSQYSIRGLTLLSGLALLGGSALLGWLGAWISVRQHLAAIEPR